MNNNIEQKLEELHIVQTRFCAFREDILIGEMDYKKNQYLLEALYLAEEAILEDIRRI